MRSKVKATVNSNDPDKTHAANKHDYFLFVKFHESYGAEVAMVYETDPTTVVALQTLIYIGRYIFSHRTS